MNNPNWQSKVTLLVNTCDAYEDLWQPFFTLLQRYFVPLQMRIVVNTETKTCTFPGLQIDTVNTTAPSYGARMRSALDQIDTEYLLLMLDDFFLREPVRMDRLSSIIDWMEADRDIVYFNCDVTEAACDREVNRYPGYRRLPAGNRYTLNLQAAVWRTDKLRQYWQHDVSPWDWEERCNVLTATHPREKFYCVLREEDRFMDYGYRKGQWMGICHGQWVREDVVPLFAREGIEVDFSKRGFLDPNQRPASLNRSASREDRYRRVYNCLGWRYMLPYFVFCRRCNLYSAMPHCAVDEDYFHYLQRKADLRNKEGKFCLFAPMVR